jgi:tripartite ATP-independent transporter DctM subunit
LFALVMGGLYGGAFTPTEAGGAGAALALIVALWRGIGWSGLRAALTETVQISAMLFLILIGAEVLGYLLSVSRITPAIAGFVEVAGWGPWQLMAAILGFYLILGCVMESLAMILLTVPIFYPLVVAAGFDPIWFGVICVVAVETGLISPPVGMNLFVVRGAAPGLRTGDLMIGVLPFVLTDVIRLAILLAVPALSLWLPGLLGG